MIDFFRYSIRNIFFFWLYSVDEFTVKWHRLGKGAKTMVKKFTTWHCLDHCLCLLYGGFIPGCIKKFTLRKSHRKMRTKWKKIFCNTRSVFKMFSFSVEPKLFVNTPLKKTLNKTIMKNAIQLQCCCTSYHGRTTVLTWTKSILKRSWKVPGKVFWRALLPPV